MTAPESSGDIVDRLEQRILSRRAFLAGVGLGGVGGAGAVIGLTRSNAGTQSLATLAGGVTLPAGTRYYLPAVDSSDTGLVVAVDFEFTEGNGELFVNLNGVEVRHDLQLALREAMETATRLTGSSLANTATHVTFETPNSDILALRGKSWEAGLTVALAAGLRQQPLTRETLITGIVDAEGALLPVGGIKEKARAAQMFGANKLLVPPADAVDVDVQGLRVIGVQSVADAVDRIFRL
ncbi:hypothetical protein NDO74_17920 [Haloferax sp. S2CR25-2]|nr:hypothetical protein [Haloferax sp. S2CR25]MDS0446309.1 hypothetical protein [Haloferax sp. S2CR25-2]